MASKYPIPFDQHNFILSYFEGVELFDGNYEGLDDFLSTADNIIEQIQKHKVTEEIFYITHFCCTKLTGKAKTLYLEKEHPNWESVKKCLRDNIQPTANTDYFKALGTISQNSHESMSDYIIRFRTLFENLVSTQRTEKDLFRSTLAEFTHERFISGIFKDSIRKVFLTVICSKLEDVFIIAKKLADADEIENHKNRILNINGNDNRNFNNYNGYNEKNRNNNSNSSNYQNRGFNQNYQNRNQYQNSNQNYNQNRYNNQNYGNNDKNYNQNYYPNYGKNYGNNDGNYNQNYDRFQGNGNNQFSNGQCDNWNNGNNSFYNDPIENSNPIQENFLPDSPLIIEDKRNVSLNY